MQWAGMPAAEATWEPVDAFRAAHPSFQLEDELFPKGGGEMLWWENSTTVGIAPVARADHRGDLPSGTAPRTRSPRLLEPGQLVQLVNQVDLLCSFELLARSEFRKVCYVCKLLI